MTAGARRTMSWLALLCGVMSAAIVGAGCGYSLAGRGNALPASIRIIGVPPITNLSPYPELDRPISEALQREFQSRGRYTIQPDATNVDAVLTCTITGVAAQPAVINTNGQVTRVRILVSANVEFKDVKADKVIWSNPSFQAREEFEIASSTTANDPAATFNQVTGAVDRLAKSFASTIVTSILEAF